MNWDNIKYLFQIPIKWFKSIHDRVFKSYGTNFIVVKEGDNGGTEISIDDLSFKNAVEQYAGDGNYVKTVNSTAPDTSGNVDVGTVKSVNNQTPDSSGNVTVQTNANLVAYGQPLLPDQQGNINLPSYILSINNVGPGSTGNLVLDVDGKVKTVNNIPPDGNGDVFIGDLVYSVNSELPDQNGNVELDIAGAVEEAIQQGEIDVGTVKSVNGYTPDSNGNVVVQDAVYSVNGLPPDATGDVDLGVIVTSVDGHQPDALGEVDFGLTGNKWVKTNANGHLTVSQEDPISIDSQRSGYLYNTNGTLSYKDEEYVTLGTTQTITASKTFASSQYFNTGSGIEMTDILGPNITLFGSAQIIPKISFAYGSVMSTIGRTSNGFEVQSDYILELQAANTVNIRGPLGICLYAGGPNQATLSHSPNSDQYDLAIATVGYVKEKVKGYTGNLTVISAVEWTGTVLRKKTATWKMKDGLLTEAPTESAWQTIDTPVVYP